MYRSAKVMAVVVVAVLGFVGCGPAVDDGSGGDVGQVTGEAKAVNPTGKNIGTLLNTSRHDRSKIAYHNGPVLTGPQNLYFIWYGNWAGDSGTQNILGELAATLGNTPYMQINSRYTDGSGRPASAGMVYAGGVTDSTYAHGSSLSDADIVAVISDQILSFALPQDPQGIYVVVASADVTATSGFCSSYCGQHNSALVNGGQLRYVFLGHANRCLSACAPQTLSPNGNAAADGMASTLAGELSDTVTDPALTSWYDRDGFENADKCAWTFGTTYAAANGAQANIHLGTRDFLLQRNFWPTSRGGVCVMNQTQALAAISNGDDILSF